MQKANGIGGNNPSALIGKADQICRMNIGTIEILQIFGEFT
jgi:hypothetical protein